MELITTGSDFSGVGAFDYAINRVAEAKGFKHERVYACDWDKYARITYIHNHGKPDYYPKDVYDREIPKDSLDIYMTSPPCQAFSLAGRRLGKNDDRGILFFNSLEFIKENYPRFFIFENVKGLLSDNNGKTFGEWVRLLGGKSVNGVPIIFPDEDSVPYHLYWQVLNSKHHGVPQNRERVFLIGIRDDQDNSFQFPKEEHLIKRIKDILEDKIDGKFYLSNKAINHLKAHKERHDKKGTGFSVELKDGESIDSTIRANASLCPTDNHIIDGKYDLSLKRRTTIEKSKRFIGYTDPEKKQTSNCIISGYFKQPTDGEYLDYNSRIRRLTPRECFRLQDFPESFDYSVVSDSQAYKQAGNSITVRVLEKILLQLPI